MATEEKKKETVGSRIADLMKVRGIKNPSELAKHSGITSQQISRILKNESEMGMGTAKKIADALGTTVAYIVGEVNDPNPEVLKALNKFDASVDAIRNESFRAQVSPKLAKDFTDEEVMERIERSNLLLQELEIKEKIVELHTELQSLKSKKLQAKGGQ